VAAASRERSNGEVTSEDGSATTGDSGRGPSVDSITMQQQQQQQQQASVVPTGTAHFDHGVDTFSDNDSRIKSDITF